MSSLDPIDRMIRRSDWKWYGFDLLPTSFGIFMALLDVVMMVTSKLISINAIPYEVGLPLATLAYAFQPFLFIKALQFENMVVVNIIWNLASDVIITAVGLFYFNEKISDPRWVAMFLSLVSIGLFSYTDVTDT